MTISGVAVSERKITCVKKSSAAEANWSVTEASAGGTGDAILTLGNTVLDRSVEKVKDEGRGAQSPRSRVTNGKQRAKPFSIEQDLSYDGLAVHLPVAMFFGESDGTPVDPGGTLPRDQAFGLAPNVNGLACSIAKGATTSHAAVQPSAQVCPSALVKAFELTVADGEVARVKTDWIGIDVFDDPAPSEDPRPSGVTVNSTLSSIAAATFDHGPDRVRMGDCKLYVDVDGGATDFADAGGQSYVIPVRRLTLKAARDLDEESFGSQKGSAPDSASRMQMPLNADGHMMPTLAFQVPRWVDDVWKGRFRANTELRARLEFTGALIESGYYFRQWFDMPLCLVNDQSFDEEGNVKQSIQLDCYTADSNPAGFDRTDALSWKVRNKQTTDLMA